MKVPQCKSTPRDRGQRLHLFWAALFLFSGPGTAAFAVAPLALQRSCGCGAHGAHVASGTRRPERRRKDATSSHGAVRKCTEPTSCKLLQVTSGYTCPICPILSPSFQRNLKKPNTRTNVHEKITIRMQLWSSFERGFSTSAPRTIPVFAMLKRMELFCLPKSNDWWLAGVDLRRKGNCWGWNAIDIIPLRMILND